MRAASIDTRPSGSPQLRALAAAAIALLTACPSDPGNPGVLYLAPDGSELEVKLQAEEPEPF